jgi:hypothetical protein
LSGKLDAGGGEAPAGIQFSAALRPEAEQLPKNLSNEMSRGRSPTVFFRSFFDVNP